MSKCGFLFWRTGFRILMFCAVLCAFAWFSGKFGALPSQIKKTNAGDDLTYVWIPPATFRMGCIPSDDACLGNELPRHTVTLTKGFWIGQTPVTQSAFRRVTGSNPSNFKGDDLPVENVSWEQAAAFCTAVRMRLPTRSRI
jgi:formylglycine-generating enzyme required for sulfatase activity